MSMNSHWCVGTATTALQKVLEVHGRRVLGICSQTVQETFSLRERLFFLFFLFPPFH